MPSPRPLELLERIAVALERERGPEPNRAIGHRNICSSFKPCLVCQGLSLCKVCG